MNRYSVIAFNHHSTGIKNLDEVFVDGAVLNERLNAIKTDLNAKGLMYLGTCNRMEFFISSPTVITGDEVSKLLHTLHPEWKAEKVEKFAKSALIFTGEEAVKHVFNVASSLDSLVVGEREIITQMRNAYDWSHAQGLTDDFIRILMRKTIETAKKVYTDTKIAEKPVSVMSLACRKLQEWRVSSNSRVIMVGAGQTADVLVKYMSKHGFTKFTVFNRTLKHAKELAAKYNIEAHSLKDLETYTGGFDILITCVQSAKPIIHKELFEKLRMGDTNMKTIVDLGLPFNVDKEVLALDNVQSVSTASIEAVAKENLEGRRAEMSAADAIIATAIEEYYRDVQGRKIEIAMSVIPKQVHKLREQAMSSVFSKEIEAMSPDSKEVLEKVVDYLEKKYISIPMQLAKEILLDPEIYS
ncbi:MAG TPA: glutamyl-tRNA reductase [Bacteroidia bacterium]|jgi:glutamyl-tRNA reductase|nr:glutamyl-tRNA reductase [Bacteroidia bacterium]